MGRGVELRQALPGMVGAWAAFLSCDARDMCRVSPTLLRNQLAVLAVLIRFVTLYFSLTTYWFDRMAGDVYWSTRLQDPEYLSFERLRNDTEEIHEEWTSGRISNEEARSYSLGAAARFRQWEDATSYEVRLLSDEYWHSETECLPFRAFDGEGMPILVGN
jgi:hypothetical protein